MQMGEIKFKPNPRIEKVKAKIETKIRSKSDRNRDRNRVFLPI